FDQSTPATTAYYQSQLAGSEMVIFENAAHEPHLEKKEEYLKTLRAFLSKAEKNGERIFITRKGQVVCPRAR
ncbi:MAG TPA: alpha/beta hydrolase, partial [Chroococcales cyanobacterium]